MDTENHQIRLDALDVRVGMRHRLDEDDVVVPRAEDAFNQRENFGITVDDGDLLRTNDRCGSGRPSHAFYCSERVCWFGQHRGPSPRTLAIHSGIVPPKKATDSLSFRAFFRPPSNLVRAM